MDEGSWMMRNENDTGERAGCVRGVHAARLASRLACGEAARGWEGEGAAPTCDLGVTSPTCVLGVLGRRVPAGDKVRLHPTTAPLGGHVGQRLFFRSI